MSAQPKKFRSKFFRVAVEGDSTDGRVIERSWLSDIAATYNPSTYGARIWMEHIRSMLPDSPFRAYGDVLAVKTEEVTVNGEKKLALFAQIEPTDDLVKMVNVSKQKVYTSIEIGPKFAGTEKPYLVGLGVTDSPASLGTERLAFAAKHPEANLFGERKQHADNLFSAASEVALEFEEVTSEPSALDRLFSALGAIAERLNGSAKPESKPDPKPTDAADFSSLATALTGIADHLKTQGDQFAQLQRDASEQRNQLQALQANYSALHTQLSGTPSGTQPTRPPVTGQQGNAALTDC
ncbi:GPO family capsid scaffolding protein [Pseudoxanthomonas wuyuanensis]|uniref:Phage capsid scaffolding protein (GPO) serine peptidase n=1 Tax=Pseudoxanthomonas wuyuanensis TaxID=1073196 RepID=A0A286D4V8_9GAMM|nr:GPO family capsid scaffolding protein [Pseudoxanthomonas wuyuanensis]KAF1719815.1 phage capsid protein [Pseudoxanthomonas wuyuanensis]SOD53697.1 Phage capsid scaffolding protein (GPO) serine peptidase [Pseudoxanthomonas wuyuanensis]